MPQKPFICISARCITGKVIDEHGDTVRGMSVSASTRNEHGHGVNEHFKTANGTPVALSKRRAIDSDGDVHTLSELEEGDIEVVRVSLVSRCIPCI